MSSIICMGSSGCLGDGCVHLLFAKLIRGDFAISIEVQLFKEILYHLLGVDDGLRAGSFKKMAKRSVD